jgi:phospho-N-acetylmuramoyl-pentapeptide-transferase
MHSVLIIIKFLILSGLAFAVSFIWVPFLSHFLTKLGMGKKIRPTSVAPIAGSLHAHKQGTPTSAGILIWLTVSVITILFYFLSIITKLDIFKFFNFLSREETLLPLGALLASAVIGFVDDYYNVKGRGSNGGGLRMWHRLALYALVAFVGAWWFYFKLDWDVIHIPFAGNFNIGFWYFPLFALVLIATSFSVNETDGLDGLAGGVLLACFAAFATISFFQGRYDLVCFCGVIIGSLVTFLWYNIYPARFFMGDTGVMSLGVVLGIIAMLTNEFLLLPIIGIVLVIESLSVIIQTFSKKIRKKKIFLSTPIHHHFEAIGWAEPKIVMRFWLLSAIGALVGLIIFLFERLL